MDLSFKVSK